MTLIFTKQVVRTSITSSLSIVSLSSLSMKHASTQAEVWCYFLSSPIHLIACCPRMHCVAAWIIHLCWRRVPLVLR